MKLNLAACVPPARSTWRGSAASSALVLCAAMWSAVGLTGCNRESDPASLALRAVADKPRVAQPAKVEAKQVEAPQSETEFMVEQLPSRSAAVVAVNAGDGLPIDFQLTDTEGSLVTPADFKGRVVALFFGATRCDHACPDTLARLHRVESVLGIRPSHASFVMVSSDGDHDTPQVLRRFVRRLSPNVRGLTGSAAAVADLARQFNVRIAAHESNEFHAVPVVLIDSRGNWRQTVSGSASAAELIEAVRPLINANQTTLSQHDRQTN